MLYDIMLILLFLLDAFAKTEITAMIMIENILLVVMVNKTMLLVLTQS